MSNDLNHAVVVGCILRKELTEQKSLRVTLGAYEEIINSQGKPMRLSVYQNIVVYGKDATECVGEVGDPYIAIGSVRQTSWKDEQDRYRENTTVKALQFRPLHGVSPERITQDAQGNKMLLGGYAHVDLLSRISKDAGQIGGPEYKVLDGGNTLFGFNVSNGEEWMQGEERKEHTNWLRVKLWGDLGDQLSALNPPKGTTLLGRYRIENGKAYTSQKTGLKVYPVDLVAIEVPLVVGRRNEQPQAESVPAKAAFTGASAAGLDDIGGFGDDAWVPDAEVELPF